MKKLIRIGTRESQLALWQANLVKDSLEELGHTCQLVLINSKGDQDTKTPLYQLGITGIFTKTLDIALLDNRIDIAVHSMKDVPTLLPKGIVKAAVLKRGNHNDVLVYKDLSFLNGTGTIATGSLRRKAQWLNKYSSHEVVGLRGNVNTRLEKLEKNPWDGAIFAKAGLSRIDKLPKQSLELDWMTPAPAQGAVMVVCRNQEPEILEALAPLNHLPTDICTQIERDFLSVLEGGCSAPIGAFATVFNDTVSLKGELLSLDGSAKIEVEKSASLGSLQDLGITAASEILDNGGTALMKLIKDAL
ncbi:MAG: hydroxymethylbilane synthase [Gilvibacter sp.]